MYTLTLTKSERDAIDWVGNRYAHGDQLFRILISQNETSDDDWDADKDILFSLPEWAAWEVYEIGEESNFLWDCFCPGLVAKMNEFCDKIV